MKSKLVIALDDLTKDEAKAIVDKVCEENTDSMDRVLFKVHDLVAMIGFEGVKEVFANTNAKIMLDGKYNDIPYTVSNYLVQLDRSGLAERVELMTVHVSAGRECLEKLVETKKKLGLDNLNIIGITCMTSLDSNDSFELFAKSPTETVLSQSKIAVETGVDAIVCSAQETPIVRAVYGDKLIIVNPGIRFDDDDKQDQKRVVTPEDAVSAGASYLVMGRSILKAADMSVAIKRALQEMSQGEYVESKDYGFERVLFNGTWQELLEYIGVAYTRKEGGKYCRLTSGLINNMYFNIGVIERYPSVLNRMCLENRKRLIESGIFDETKLEDYAVLGAQMGSVRISAILAQALGVNGTSIYTEKTGETSYGMALKRHLIDLKGKKVIIGEDIVMMGSTLSSMIPLIREYGGEVVAVAVAGNRSGKKEFLGVPIISCFVPAECEIYFDEKTPEEKRADFPQLPEGEVVCEKVKASWDELILSMRK